MKNYSARFWINTLIKVFRIGVVLSLIFGFLPARSVAAATGISISDVTVTEPAPSSTGIADFKVTCDPTSGPFTLNYSTSDGTAQSGVDYEGVTNGTLAISDCSNPPPISITILGDNLLEPDKTFTVTISSLDPADAFVQSTATATIQDTLTSGLSIARVSDAVEPTQDGLFVLSLENPVSSPLNVTYTVGGSAVPGSDYTGLPGTITIPAGDTSANLPVLVLNDHKAGPDKTVSVTLTGADFPRVTLSTSSASLTIKEADTASLSIDNPTVTEGDSGTLNMQFTVTLSIASTAPVSVDFTTLDGTANAGSDYQTTSGTLDFAAGVTSQTISVPIIGDLLNEPTETFTVVLSNAINAAISTPTGTGTIIDNDAVPSLSIDDMSVVEGLSGTQPMTFTVTLTAASSQTVTVAYATVDGTALSPSDYIATSGLVTFAPGTTTQTITVTINGDMIAEPTQTFTVHLSNPTNATITKADGTGSIIDIDPPTLSINDASATEGNFGTTPMTFTVTMTGATEFTVTVDYTTIAGTATTPSDFVANSGTLTFLPGVLTQTITISIASDLVNEPTETFLVRLSNPANATLVKSDGTGTITDNDPLPTLSINNASLTEGDGGTSPMTFTVTKSGATSQAVTVAYATIAGTATSPSDYTTTTGTLTFPPGVLTQTISIPIVGDLSYEPTQTFLVRLSNPTNATITISDGTGTITDNDPPPTVSFSQSAPYSVLENDPSGHAVIQVVLSAASDFTVSVGYTTSNGSALQGVNYQTTTGTLSFPPGITTQSIIVPIVNDHKNDPTLTLFIILSAPGNATLGDSSATLAIFDQDPQPALSINNVSLSEGNNGVTDFSFTVTLFVASGNVVTVDYGTLDGTATSGSDYVSTSGTLSFSPGVVSKTITVPVNGDTVKEADETFMVRLSNANNATILADTGIGTILDDDLFQIMLPMVYNSENIPDQPDLTVTEFTLTPSQTIYTTGQAVTVTVKIKNIGTVDAGPFWVDFYINPKPAPVNANIPWNTVCGINPCQGIAWDVTGGLKAGKTITLTSTVKSYSPDFTVWSGSLPVGTSDLYVYVDSWAGNGDPNGAVVEASETNNRAEIQRIAVTGAKTP